jgi:hypothetical protein
MLDLGRLEASWSLAGCDVGYYLAPEGLGCVSDEAFVLPPPRTWTVTYDDPAWAQIRSNPPRPAYSVPIKAPGPPSAGTPDTRVGSAAAPVVIDPGPVGRAAGASPH